MLRTPTSARLLTAVLLALSPIVRPSAASAQLPTVTLTALQSTADEGAGTIANAFRLSRTGSTKEGSLNVVLRFLGNTASGADHAPLPVTVTISRDSASLTLPLTILQDALPEIDEQVIVIVSENSAYVTQNAPNPSTTQGITILDDDIRLTLTPADTLAQEPGSDQAIVVLDRAGSLSRTGTYQLALTGSATNGTDYNTIPGTRTLNAGQRKDTIVIVARPDNLSEQTETVIVSVSNISTFGGGQSSTSGAVTARIVDARVSVASSLPTLTEVAGNVGTFVLTRTGDLSTSQNVGYALSGTATNGTDFDAVASPASVTFPANAPTVTLPITLRADQAAEGSETIVLTVLGGASVAVGTPNVSTMVIDESGATIVASLTLSRSTMTGGDSARATVTINGPAPAEGRAITLSSTLPSVVIPPSVTIPPGGTSTTFPVSSSPVASNVSGIFSAVAAVGSPVTTPFTVLAPVLTTLTVTPATATPPRSGLILRVAGRVTLDFPAPEGGTEVQLTSSAPNIASVPATVTVNGGVVAKEFLFIPTAVPSDANVTITATRGNVSRSQTLTVRSPVVSNIAINPFPANGLIGRIDEAQPAAGTVTLTGGAPVGGLPLTLRVGVGDALDFADSVLVIPANQGTGSFVAYARPIRRGDFARITTSRGGEFAVSVRAPSASSLQLNTSSVVGGSNTTARVTMNGHAPGSFFLRVFGSPVAFWCSSSGTALDSIPFPKDSIAANFPICSKPVTADTTVTLVATSNSSATLRVTPIAPATGTTGTVPVQSPAVANLVLSASTVTGGQSVTGTITLSLPAPANFTVPLSSTGAMASVPTSVAVPQGQTSATFPVNTFPVTATTNVTIVAGTGANARPRPLTITP